MYILIVRKEAFGAPRQAAVGMALAAGMGAAAQYLLDPVSGRRRRALLRDRVVHWRHASEEMLRRSAVDLRNRMVGSLAEVRAHLREGPTDDRVLAERVRTALGRHVPHRGGIEVSVQEGVVTLVGPVLEREARRALGAARRIPGVREVRDDLERHPTSENVPALQGQARTSPEMALFQESWPPAVRMLTSIAGAALAAQAVASPWRVLRGLTTMGGLLLLARSATNLPLKRMVGIGAGRRAIDVNKAIHIACPPEEVFSFCRSFESLPQFMSHVRKVEPVGDNRYHWEASGPLGITVRWDAEITKLEENHLLAWKSTPDSPLEQAGVLRVDPENGGTRLQIRMSYNPTGGAMGHAVASLFGADPKHALDDDLLRLKSLLETGKATAHGKQVTREGVGVPQRTG
jgi:uncharacterized membrane protein